LAGRILSRYYRNRRRPGHDPARKRLLRISQLGFTPALPSFSVTSA
jgi:hypothetical protein